MSRKNDPKRGIPKEAVHQALRSAVGSDGRAGEEATNIAHRQVESFLHDIGRKTADVVTLKKMKTVKIDTLEYVVAQNYSNLKSQVIAAHRAHKNVSGESVIRRESAARVFRRGAAREIRMTEEVKGELAAIASVYLASLAQRAALFANAAGRKGIKPADVRRASSLG